MKALARHRAHLLFRMTLCDFKLRDQGTFFGFLWTLLNPLLMFGVLYLVFNAWFGKLVPHYPIYLGLGIVHWNFFSLATSNTVTIFERKRHILKAFPIARGLVPLSSVLTIFASYIIEAYCMMLLSSYATPLTLSGFVCFTALLLIHLVLVAGTSLLLANAFIYFRDVSHLWGIVLRIGFFLTPVFYPPVMVDEFKLMILKLNPLFHLFSASREALLTGSVTIDGYFAYLVVFSITTFAVACRLYRFNEAHLVERL